MTNGKIIDAEIDLELTGDRRSIDRLLLTGQKELKASLTELKTSVDDMRKVCANRGLLCPGLQAADPVTPRKEREEEDRRRTWVMWSVSTGLAERVALPLVLVGLTILLTRVFG